MFAEFSLVLGTDDFRRVFPDTRLLISMPEITAAREGMPDALFPFICEEQPSWSDIYAFDLRSEAPEFQVVVWADHAAVMNWPSFPAFFQWVRERIAKHDDAA